jgi:hypothetical protein
MSAEPTIDDFANHISPGSWLLTKKTDIEQHPGLLSYSHYLRQAWDELNLSAVLCVDGRPTVYICEGIRFTPQQKRDGHRFVWNQGLVPLLIFVTSNQVEVHSAVKKPERSDKLFDHELTSLIPAFANISDTLASAGLIRAIETGQFFQNNLEFFPANETVDQCLVENLLHAVRRLKETGWNLHLSHSLLGRVLFVSFLEERKFILPHYYPAGTARFLDILKRPRVGEAKRLLYKEFFPRLKDEFNGTMFDSALLEEEQNVGKAQLEIVFDFLSGNDMATGQMTLDFWAYDFRFIPVELISAIYEEFMKEANLQKRRKEAAYYTPRNLAETTLHVALEHRYLSTEGWRVLDPACGSGIFLVGLFNLLAEQWRQKNATRRKQTKAQALLNILQTQLRGVDLNLDACRITVFSLYLALFEKLIPIDVEEFKQTVSKGPFLPPLLWTSEEPVKNPVVFWGDFLKDYLPLGNDFHLVIGNPPWDNRGSQQIALHFAVRSQQFLRPGGVGCFLLPAAVLVNRHGSLDGDWFRSVTVEKIVQLADFRFVLFEATHPCFILRYVQATPSLEHSICYETPKLNRFDRLQGVIIVEPDDQKSVPQRRVLEAALQRRLQLLWSRKFWGSPRDESFLRRLDYYPRLSEIVGVRGKAKRWLSGTGLQPHFENRKYKHYKPVNNPYGLDDAFLDANEEGIKLVLFDNQLTTLGKKLSDIEASTTKVLFARSERNFQPPMILYNKGFTKFAFSDYAVRFFDGLRSITSEDDKDADLLRFLTAAFQSRLFAYIRFHDGSNFGVGRDQLHLYEALDLPFPLPDDELAAPNAREIVAEAANILKRIARAGKSLSHDKRADLLRDAERELEPLVEAYFSLTETEKILIEDTLNISHPSIHPHDLNADCPTLAFPALTDRKNYAETLCAVLNERVRKPLIIVNAEMMVSDSLNLILLTIIFSSTPAPYRETGGNDELWNALESVSKAAERSNRAFTYLRGFSYVESDRLHLLKPATMRNWSRAAALNDADAIFDHLASQ